MIEKTSYSPADPITRTTLGIDIGGTFTDCVVSRGEDLHIGKALSTPPDFHQGFIDAIDAVARSFGAAATSVLPETEEILHGCTVGSNALIEHRTAKVGLLTTRGHKDSIFTMQSGRRLRELAPQEIAQVAKHTKPSPIVPRQLVRELDERVGVDGKVIVPISEEQIRTQVEELLEEGVEAFAVSLLWSVANDSHERLIATVIEELAPGIYISVASRVAPRTGEYERTVATVVNSLIGPEMDLYLSQLEGMCAELGYRGQIRIMTCSGGLISTAEARELPILTIGSGPVAGLIGARKLAAASSKAPNVLTADMGGTTLDVGVIHAGVPLTRPTSWYEQFEYYTPTLDVRSVGSGGGSIIAFDPVTGSLSVGPESAGSRPGPVCYGRGGSLPTVTDADLVAGFLNPDYFLGGEMQLDMEGARAALASAGGPLGLGPEETAIAALRIVDNQMADAIRLVSVNKGLDPREFAIYACGGAGALHAAAIAGELGISRIVVPLGDFASGWSAFGVAGAEPLIVEEIAAPMQYPFDPEQLNALWARLETETTKRMRGQGVPAEETVLTRQVDMRYSLQVNEVGIDGPGGAYDESTVATLIERFESEYQRIYGRDSGYADAGYAITALRVLGRGPSRTIPVNPSRNEGEPPQPSGKRAVRFHARGGEAEEIPTFNQAAIRAGVELRGPAIIELPDTSIVAPHESILTVDERGSACISIGPVGGKTR